MIIKIKDNKLVKMSEYCDPMWKEKYIPRYQNGVMPNGIINDEQVLVGYELNKKCQYSDECQCFNLQLPAEFSGNINDYNYEVLGKSILLTTLTDEAKNRVLLNELFALKDELSSSDYIFIKKSEYEIVGKNQENYNLFELSETRQCLRDKINLITQQLVERGIAI